MPLIDFATAVKSELVYKSAGYAVNTYNPTSGLDYAFDGRGYYEAVLIVNCGTFASNGTLTITLQESSDASAWTDLPGGVFPVIAQAPSGAQVEDDAQYYCRVNLFDKKRYIGVKSDVETQRATFSVAALLLSYDTNNSDTPSLSI